MLDWHPSYAAHLEWALLDVGFISPRVLDDGEMEFIPLERDERGEWKNDHEPIIAPGREYNVNLLLTALAQADAASGQTTGRKFAESLLDEHGVEGGEAYFESIREAHVGNLRYISESAEFVARRTAAQARGKVIPVEV
jgi:hypothetical protein